MSQAWEYRLIEQKDSARLLEQLAAAGDEGWEAIGMTRMAPPAGTAEANDGVAVLMKRPKAVPRTVLTQRAHAAGWQPNGWK